MKEWFSYNAFSQKWYNANGDVVEPCEINNKLRSMQSELPALRQERDSLQKLSKRLSYVVAVCKNWDVFPLDGCDEVDEILDEPTVKAAIYDAHEFINSGVDAHLLCDKPKESL